MSMKTIECLVQGFNKMIISILYQRIEPYADLLNYERSHTSKIMSVPYDVNKKVCAVFI